MTTIPATQLAERIQRLVEQRQQHADAITAIDRILSGVDAALSAGRSGPQAKPAAAAATPVAKRRRRGRGQYATTAEESILNYVRTNKNPTTADIKKHWASEKRGGSADNALGKLFREKKLKRTPIGGGIRGSRYSLP